MGNEARGSGEGHVLPHALNPESAARIVLPLACQASSNGVRSPNSH